MDIIALRLLTCLLEFGKRDMPKLEFNKRGTLLALFIMLSIGYILYSYESNTERENSSEYCE